MSRTFDISLMGDKALQKKLDRLSRVAARRVVAPAMRKSAKRVAGYVQANIARVLTVRTGVYGRAWGAVKVRAGKHPRGMVRLGIKYPTREELGIAPDDPYYYMNAIEFGHGNVPAYPHIRPAVDDNIGIERALIGRDIGRGIEREARRG